jgi:hypothetical protein
MDEAVALATAEAPAGRPFAHPDRTRGDWVTVGTMADALRRVLAVPGALPLRPRPLVLELPEPDGRRHRIVVCQEALLRAALAHGVVAFFGAKRPGLDHTVLDRTDEELIEEFPDHPGVLSYSSLLLPDGNYANLILVHPADARERWREGVRHAWAVRELAPRHYATVRLHQALFPAGLLAGGVPRLCRTKYYDFGNGMPWHAVRELASEA